MNFEEANNIPGMIELVEREMLFNQAREISLIETDCVVEFGSFFGVLLWLMRGQLLTVN